MIPSKHIPSFGRRKARRLRKASQKAYEEVLPLLKIDPAALPFKDPPSEVWLEIGFGSGEHLLALLAHNSHVSIVGCETFMNGVAQLLVHLPLEDYPRTRIWHEDVRYLLGMVPSAYFSRVFILFPDPWPKKRQQRRRLINTEFMAQLLPTLKEGGLLYIASDDSSYVGHIQTTLYQHPGLKVCEGPVSENPLTWDPRPEGWPPTRYEQKALADGKKCAYMMFQKRER